MGRLIDRFTHWLGIGPNLEKVEPEEPQPELVVLNSLEVQYNIEITPPIVRLILRTHVGSCPDKDNRNENGCPVDFDELTCDQLTMVMDTHSMVAFADRLMKAQALIADALWDRYVAEKTADEETVDAEPPPF